MAFVDFIIYAIYLGAKTPGWKRWFPMKRDTRDFITFYPWLYGGMLGFVFCIILHNPLFIYITPLCCIAIGYLARKRYTEKRIGELDDYYADRLSLRQARLILYTVALAPLIALFFMLYYIV